MAQGPASGGTQDETASGNAWSIAAMVLGVLAFLLIPVIFGPLALIAAGLAWWRRERLWTWGAGFAAGGLVVGTIVNVWLYSQRH